MSRELSCIFGLDRNSDFNETYFNFIFLLILVWSIVRRQKVPGAPWGILTDGITL